MCSLLERRSQHQENMQSEAENINHELAAEYLISGKVQLRGSLSWI